MYICIDCGKSMTREEIEMPHGVKCPFCNGKVFKKARPEWSKKVEAK